MTLRELQAARPGEPYRRKGWATACLGQGLDGEPWDRRRIDAEVERMMFEPVAIDGNVGYGISQSSLIRAPYTLSPEELRADDWGPCDLAQFQAWASRRWSR